MSTFIIQDLVKIADEEKSAINQKNKDYNSGLRALLSIRDIDFVLEKHYYQIMQIENKVESGNTEIFTEFESHCNPESKLTLKDALNKIGFAVFSITKILNAVKEKIAEKNRSDSSEIWNRFDTQLEQLKKDFSYLMVLGDDILPANLHPIWKNRIETFETSLLSAIISYARSCRVELQMLERYTIEEMNTIIQIIVSKIPKDFNMDESEAYEKDYLVALKDFKQEFSEEKNLWDTFLDILAGGTHQSPSEHVMMERWIEGEKRDL